MLWELISALPCWWQEQCAQFSFLAVSCMLLSHKGLHLAHAAPGKDLLFVWVRCVVEALEVDCGQLTLQNAPSCMLEMSYCNPLTLQKHGTSDPDLLPCVHRESLGAQ